jgi:ankyrin repeat protein
MKCIKKLSIFGVFLLTIAPCINHGMEPNDVLLDAAQNNDCLMITQLLNEGADINISESIGGSTALMIAAYYGHQEAVQCLLNNPNIVIDQQDYNGRTALMFAAAEDKCPIIQNLLKHGADCNIADSAGDTALMITVSKENIDAVQSLLSCKNIAINQQDDQGSTALLLAIYKKNKLIIKLLLDAGADPELANHRGVTPRKAAIQITYPEGYQANSPELLNMPIKIGGDAEILSLINKAIIRKHGGVNPFIEAQK